MRAPHVACAEDEKLGPELERPFRVVTVRGLGVGDPIASILEHQLPDQRSIEEIDLEKYDAVALVDTQPRAGNNSLPDTRPPDIA